MKSRFICGLIVAATVVGLALLAANLGVYSAAQFLRAQTAQGERQTQADRAVSTTPAHVAGILPTMLPGATGALLGAVLGFFLEPLRGRVFGPRLRVWFDGADGKHMADSPMIVPQASRSPQEVQSRWVRVSIENIGRSHLVDGEAFLVAVHREEDGRWAATPFIDPLRLPWSSSDPESGFRVRDLPRGVQFFVDVCRSVQGAWGQSDEFNIVANPIPFRLRYLFSTYGRYRLTVTVTGKGIKPTGRKVIVTWVGAWDKLDAVDSGDT